MTRKVINDAVAYLQSLGELRERNIEWAEETVRFGANLRASEALEQNVIDLVVPDMSPLLAQIDGWSVTLPRSAPQPADLRALRRALRRDFVRAAVFL